MARARASSRSAVSFNNRVPAGAGHRRRRAPRRRKWVLAWSAMKTSRNPNLIGMTRCVQTGSIARTITARASQPPQYMPANLAIVIGTRALQTLATRCARNRTSAMGLVVIMFAHTQMSQGGGVVAEPAGQSGRISSKLASSLVAVSGTAQAQAIRSIARGPQSPSQTWATFPFAIDRFTF